ncbi:FirrV-1-B7 [Feldmannia irregularis virus a]|uniref:FirrV-1-B7 n=1 Tax=Feldmannia irregularis virus a TaxID=231992 RepID=Q6XM29_9PHYC|nr:FirrV-1-B7 [Feldmannia irregularis virus a]AAR26882.1 FirrV-1-B7 [Feldmannia irregularis virus a]
MAPKLQVVWHHKVLKETAVGISHALSMMGLEHDLRFLPFSDIEDTGDLFIIVGVHHFKKLPANYIVIQVEQAASNWFNASMYGALRGALAVIDFSPRLTTKWAKLGCPFSFYVPIRIPLHPFVGVHPPSVQDIDVLFYGGRRERRVAIEQQLRRALPGRCVLFRYYDLFGAEREEKIARSKIVLNLHFWPESSLETHRIEYLLARGACVVSERSSDPVLDAEYEACVTFSEYSSIVSEVVGLLADHERRKDLSRTGYVSVYKRQMNCSHLREAFNSICN